MRINRFVATASGMSRRQADAAIEAGRVSIDGSVATPGDTISESQTVTIDTKVLSLPSAQTIILHKPVGYICSRAQQGSSPTIYELLPSSFYQLKPVGRLDKDSSGLLLLTNDGKLAHRLAHPSNHKWKVYQVTTTPALTPSQLQALRQGVMLDDGPSQMEIEEHHNGYTIRLQEGRNRQIRRSIEAVGSKVATLHRTQFGEFKLGGLKPGDWRELRAEELTD